MFRALKFLAKYLMYFVAFLILYCLAGWLVPKIPVNKEEVANTHIPIYIRTNGAHTDVIVPIKNSIKDWSKFIAFSNTLSKDSAFTFVALGWGDKGFYLEIPTWSDLTFSVAFKAAFGLSKAAMHTTYYNEPVVNDSCKQIMLSAQQYRKLVAYVEDAFETSASGQPVYISTTAQYGVNDAFYEAKGTYNLFFTCNTWSNNALKVCGQKAALWTPTSAGIFQHY